MVGSKEAGVFRVMSLGISSRVYPTASLAAILAMGNPVAFGGQGGGAGDPRVHLDDDHPAVLRPDRKLDVRSSCLYPDLPNDPDGRIPHPLVFFVRQGLGRSHGDAVPRVDAHGIEIFDGADDDDIVLEIPHHLQFEFLPAEDRLLDQDLADHARFEAAGSHFFELLDIVGDAAPGSSQGEAGPDDQGETDLFGDLHGLLKGVGQSASGKIEADLLHRFFEEVPVFPFLDGLVLGPDHLDAIFLKNPVLIERHRDIEAGLAAQRGKKGIRSFALDDLFKDFGVIGSI